MHLLMHHTTQEVAVFDGDDVRRLSLPSAEQEVLPGVPFGAFEQALTPAFWAARAFIEGPRGHLDPEPRGASLREEIAACLLGGYGIPAEVGWAAFVRLRDAGALDGGATIAQVTELLSTPLSFGSRSARYRFARQKSDALVRALDRLEQLHPLPDDDRALREALLELPGVGRKTASWITRNWRRSDHVAVLDVHICRACETAGVFPRGADPARRYLDLEQRFLSLAAALDVRASILDNLMWQTMRRLSRIVDRSWLHLRERRP
jgi:thermostable 8-oxoguanine DNA glycosylase